jgi:hypothetical protein
MSSAVVSPDDPHKIAGAIERALLGSLMLPESPRLCDLGLSTDDFLLSAHRFILRAIRSIDSRGEPIDPILICAELGQNLEAVGGAAYVAALLDGCVPQNAARYAAEIKKAAFQRRAMNAAEIFQSKLAGGESLAVALLDLQQSLKEAPGETLGHTFEEIENVRSVNWAIEGFLQEDGITAIGGLSGNGKTLVMLEMTRALLEGEKLFHRFPVTTPATKVIYLIPESGLAPFAHRLRLFHLTEFVREGRLIVRTMSKKPIGLGDSLLLKEAPGADVFLDTVTRFKSGDENDAAENASFAEDLFNLQRAGARTIVGAHHAPKGFAKDTVMTLEGILRGSGDIGAMLATCWGIRQIDADTNRVFIGNVKARDFSPSEPFIVQGRPGIDLNGYFDLTEPPGFAGELADHLSNKEGRRSGPSITADKHVEALRLHAAGRSLRQVAEAVGVGKSTVERWISDLREVQ